MEELKKELKKLSDKELDATHKYYKERAEILSKEEYNYLIEIEREQCIRLKSK